MLICPKPKSLEIFENQFLPLAQGDVSLSENGLPQGGKLKLDLSRSDMNPEGYELEITPTEIKISAASEAGARLAFQTLRQVVAQGTQAGVQCLKISDYPDLPVRGFMLDISRCKVPTMSSLMYLVDMLSLFKFNRLELYTEHTYTFAGHELVWGDATPMNPQQYKMLDLVCKRANIELVPNMNSMGHMDRWLRYPEYRHLAEHEKAPLTDPLGNVRPYPTTLAFDEKSIDFMKGLYKDFLPNFTSKNFHVGCDEPWELGMGKSAERCKKEGRSKVYISYLKELAKLCKEEGKRMHFWADILLEDPALSEELPADLVAVLWGYYPDSAIDEEAEILHKYKRPFIIAGGTNTWNSFAIRLDAALGNVSTVCAAAKKWGAEGAMLTNWGDNGNHQAWSPMWMPLLAFAQSAWGENFVETDICKALDMFVFQDPEQMMSKAIVELGRCDPGQKLYSLHNKLFFANAMELAKLIQIDKADAHFEKMYKGVCNAIEYLKKAKPHCPDAEICVSELILAADLIKWSVVRASNDPEIKSLDLRKALKMMKSQYEQIWLGRARIGGLFESSARAFLDREES